MQAVEYEHPVSDPAGITRSFCSTVLVTALREDQLRLLYQPLVDLETGTVATLEALLRWQHPELGLLSAQKFLPQMVASDLMSPLSQWVLNQVCSDLAAWYRNGHDRLQASINVSPQEFCDPGFGGAIREMLQHYGVPPSALALEITEIALTEAGDRCGDFFARLRKLGLRLTLDDFGTGHSSLANLKRYAFDALKIDSIFVRDVTTNTGDAALCKTIIAMGHNLGMKVVAEGVETAAQCDFLRRNMCDHIQGYFFSGPLSSSEVETLLVSRHALPPHLLRMQKPRRRLLLVDDEPNIVAALQRLLRRENYQIHTANSGAQGLEVLAENAVDIIVSDQRMPGMLGADFLRKAREIFPDTIRIMLSGYTELQSVTDAVNEGAIYKFLTKPWDDEQLRGHIAEAFRIKEIADDNERLHMEVRSANQELASANRKLELLLTEKQEQISLDEITLKVARELMQHLPLAIIGLDDAGMVAFINGTAEELLPCGGTLLGNEASVVLPQLFPINEDAQAPAATVSDSHSQHVTDIDGVPYFVVRYPMGERSASRGSLLTITRQQEAM